MVYLEFGDGTFGMVPPRGLNNIVASYSVGGGAKGNVPAYAISKPVTAIDQLKLVANAPSADGLRSGVASGGADAEDHGLGRAERAAPLPLDGARGHRPTTRCSPRTSAWARPRQGQQLEQHPLIVAPAGGGIVSDTLKQDLLAFLDTKRIMTSIVQIVDPTYVQVLIDATVTVLPQFSRKPCSRSVVDAVTKLFAFDNVELRPDNLHQQGVRGDPGPRRRAGRERHHVRPQATQFDVNAPDAR